MLYVITKYCGNQREFWSNEHGWVDIVECDLFTFEERMNLDLPQGDGGDVIWVPAASMMQSEIVRALDITFADSDEEIDGGDFVQLMATLHARRLQIRGVIAAIEAAGE